MKGKKVLFVQELPICSSLVGSFGARRTRWLEGEGVTALRAFRFTAVVCAVIFCLLPAAFCQDSATTAKTLKWKLPSTERPKPRSAKLVNYCHNLAELHHSGIPRADLEAMLAQWDLLVLFPFPMPSLGPSISIDNVRRINPKITILAWMPLQGPSGDAWRRSIPAADFDRWSGRNRDGQFVMAPWQERIMNPVADNYGWPRYVISFVERNCLVKKSGTYDGVMLDCLWSAPAFGVDANADGILDQHDITAWRDANSFLLRSLRGSHPSAILTANAGPPLQQGDSFLELLNGSMHENALGNEFGDHNATWQSLWRGFQASVQATRNTSRRPMHLIVTDVRMNRSMRKAEQLRSLSPDDLRRMRLGLCTSMLEDGGYFGFDRGDCLHGQLWWFDEYDADLGQPISSFKKDHFGKDLYSRQFEQGLIVVNTSTQPVTLKLKQKYIDISSRRSSCQMTIPPLDGRILQRSIGVD